MSCSNCGLILSKYNYSCTRFKNCYDKNPICYNCAKRYVSSPIRSCPNCKKLGTCEMCCDYDMNEINRRKNLTKDKSNWEILQMCPSCFDEYLSHENDC